MKVSGTAGEQCVTDKCDHVGCKSLALHKMKVKRKDKARSWSRGMGTLGLWGLDIWDWWHGGHGQAGMGWTGLDGRG